MDIILKPIVNFIQNLDGMNNSILAGGSVRDAMLGLTPRDYDIFVPSKDKKHLVDAVNLIRSEFTTSDVTSKSKEYDIFPTRLSRDTSLVEVLNFKYKDRDIDIIGVYADDDEDFPIKTIESFDYGINMVYDTGRYIDDSHSKFRRDFDNHYMTLHRLDYLDALPKAMQRFNNFNNRAQEHLGYTFYFDSPILRIQKGETLKIKPLQTAQTTEVWLDEQAVPEPTNLVANAFATNAFNAFTTANTATTAANW